MAYETNFTFSQFQAKVKEHFRPGFENSEYKQEAARVIRATRSELLSGKNIKETNAQWARWFSSIDPGPVKNDKGHLLDLKKFSDNTIRALADDDTNIFYAFAIHYRLHGYRSAEKLRFAMDLDHCVFGAPIETAIGQRVFVFEPEELIRNPPLLAAPISYPPYVSKSEVERLIAEDIDDSVWLNPHNHYTIPLEGREVEKQCLTDFMESSGHFRVQPVIAQSGAGKTRLISEWMKPYAANFNPDSEWEAGFLISDHNEHARSPEPWKSWVIKKNTLIVIDYTYAFDEVVKAIAEKAMRQEGDIQFDVRLIVVDHVMPRVLSDDFFWSRFTGGHASSMDGFRVRYIEKPVLLESPINNVDHLRKIIAAAASIGKENIKTDHPLVQSALVQLDGMGDGLAQRDAARHPLFAALIGGIIRNADGAPNFSKWSRRDLLTYYFSSPDRLPWAGWDNLLSDMEVVEKTQTGLYAGAVVSVATLRRGMSIGTVQQHVPENHKKIIQLASRVVAADCSEIVPPFYPDILGEAFVLSFLEAMQSHTQVQECLLHMLNDEREGSPQSAADRYFETVDRLLRNLANDDPCRGDVTNYWAVLVRFLNPSSYPAQAPIRQNVSFLVTIAMEHITKTIENLQASIGKAKPIHSAENTIRHYESLLSLLEEQFDFEDQIRAANGPNLISATEAVIRYFEFAKISERDDRLGCLEFLAKQFSRHSERKWPAIVFAAYHGRLNCIAHLLAVTSETVNEKSERGRTALMAACQNGHLHVLQLLYEQGADVDAVTESGETAIMVASQYGHTEVVRFLLEQGANFQVSDCHGSTAAMAASHSGQLKALKLLQDWGADLNAARHDGWTAAFYASLRGNAEVLRYLHDCGVDLNETLRDGANAAVFACLEGHLAALQALHECGVDLNVTTKSGRTLAMMASQNGHLDLVQYLQRCGVDLNAVAEGGLTASLLASQGGHVAVLRFLKESGADFQGATSSGRTIVALASEEGHREVLQFLSAQGIDLHQAAQDGTTAAMWASHGGQLDTLSFLSDHGADLNAVGDDGFTAALAASRCGHFEVLQFLGAKEADLAAACNEGWSAIMLSSLEGHLPVVKFLNENGADVNAVSKDGATATIAASQNGHFEVLKYLHEEGASLNVETHDGRTIGLLALQAANLDVLRYLHENKADFKASIEKGITFTHVVYLRNFPEILEFLQEIRVRVPVSKYLIYHLAQFPKKAKFVYSSIKRSIMG